MSRRFLDKVVIVTGAGSGMGRAAAIRFAAEGAKVVVADINAEGSVDTHKQIIDAGGDALCIPTDVTQADSVQEMVNRTVSHYGRLNCAFNNAGVIGSAKGALLHEIPEESFDREIAINLKGIFLCLKYELPVLLAAGGGSIVNTLSVLGLIAAPGQSSYVASKHGAYGLTRTAAQEYAGKGIRINGICPGAIDTPMMNAARAANPEVGSRVPLGRLGKPDEIASAALWLCSDEASYVTGQCLGVDGGMFPR